MHPQYTPNENHNRICEVCGTPFHSDPAKIRKGHGRFCSKRCKGVATSGEKSHLWKAKTAKTCPQCGTTFLVTPCHLDRKFCSKTCADDSRRTKPVRIPAAPRQKKLPGFCVLCGAPLRSGIKFCSKTCLYRSRFGKLGRSTVKRTCLICGKDFETHEHDANRGMGKFCSRDCYAAYQSSTNHQKYTRAHGGRRDDLDGLYVRSRWEANWARYLNWLISVGEILSWEYEPETFHFEKIKRGQRFYTPDFKVTNKDGSIEYHEVKGYMDQPSRTKLDRMKRYHPHIKVIVIAEATYKDMAKKIGRRLPGWESDGKKAA